MNVNDAQDFTNEVLSKLEEISGKANLVFTSEIEKNLFTKVVITFPDSSVCILIVQPDIRCVIVDSFIQPEASNVINIFTVANLIELIRQQHLKVLLEPDVLHEAIGVLETITVAKGELNEQ